MQKLYDNLRPSRNVILLLSALVLATNSSFAQDVELIAPRADRAPADEATIAAAEEEDFFEITASGESVGTIQGIRLVATPGEVNVDHPPVTSGVVVGSDNLEVPPGVLGAIEPFIGQPLSLRTIQEINRDAVLAYRAAGLPVVDMGFPEQSVSEGVLQLVIIVGRAGEIRLEGNQYFDDQIYLRSFTTEPGDLIWEAPIIDDLNYLNRNPYRQVNLIYTPGTGFGEADLILSAEERRPWTVYTGYENTGNQFLGENRFFLGAEYGNVGGLDHIVGYQYTTTDNFDTLHAHSMTYRIPIWQHRHELRLLGAYVEAEGVLVDPITRTITTSGGVSSQLSASYLIPAPMIAGYTHEVEIGFDQKSTNNNLEFGGLQVFNTTAEVYQFSVQQRLSKRLDFGYQSLSHQLVWSPGGFNNQNSDAAFNSIRAFAESDYVYWRGEVLQSVDLPHGFTFVFDAEAQLSNGNLLPSESLLLGGVNSVRGFEQNLLRSDEGAQVSLELYAPPLQRSGKTAVDATGKGIVAEPVGKLFHQARLFGFYDQAWGSNKDLLPGERGVQLGALGLGLNYELADFFSARVSYGWQVNEIGFNDGENGRWQFYGTLRY